MGLKKIKETSSGVTGDYWKITKVIHHRLDEKTEVELNLFKDKASSVAKKTPIIGVAKKTLWMEDKNAEGATVKECYAAVKAQSKEEDTHDNYFADAEDV